MTVQPHAINVVIATVVVVAMAISFTSACPFPVETIELMSNFSSERFSGVWYEVMFKAPYFDDNPVLKNVGERFTPIGKNEIHVEAQGSISGALNCIKYNRTLTFSPSEPARMTSTFVFNSTAETDVEYLIINTDYDNFAIVFGCTELAWDGYCEQTHGWVLGRQTVLPDTVRQTVDSDLRKICEAPDDYLLIEHSMECIPPDNGSRQGIAWNLMTLLLVALAAALSA